MSKLLTANWPAPQNVIAFTTLRNTDHTTLNLPMQPIRLNQVHGKTITLIEETVTTVDADAALTFQPNKVCAVRTADCLPVLICDQQGTQVAAIHAGWRGLAQGVIAATCKKMTADKANCLAWIGPAIGPQVFEVGADVIENFAAYGWSKSDLDLAFQPRSNTPGKWLGNLVYLARITLQEQGIDADNIYGGEWCTYSDPERFCSYRRSNDNDRMTSMIWFT